MRVIIKSSNVRQEKTQKGTVIIKQQAAMDQGRDFPLVFDLVVSEPYPAGEYILDPGSFRISQYGSLELDPYGLKLKPLSK